MKQKRPARKDRSEVSRRKFLASIAVAGATTTAARSAAATPRDAALPGAPLPRRPSALPPSARVAAAESGTPRDLPRIGGVAGSDFMVDVIKTLEIKYLPS